MQEEDEWLVKPSKLLKNKLVGLGIEKRQAAVRGTIHVEDWQAQDVTIKILELRGMCNNQRARKNFEKGTLYISTSPFHLKGQMPDYRNEKWENQDIRAKREKEEGTTTDEGKMRHDTADKRKRAEEKGEASRAHVDNKSIQGTSNTTQTEVIKDKSDDGKRRGSENNADTQQGRPHDEKTSGPNEHTNRKRTQDQEGEAEEGKEGDNATGDKKEDGKREQKGSSDVGNRRRKSVIEQTERHEDDNRPLTEEEIQSFIRGLPGNARKRKADTEENGAEVRSGAENKKEKEGRKEARNGRSGINVIEKGNTKADENEYLKDEQIQQFIASMGSDGNSEEEDKKKYTQVGGSRGSGEGEKHRNTKKDNKSKQENLREYDLTKTRPEEQDTEEKAKSGKKQETV